MNKFKVLSLCISMLLAGFSFAQIQKNGTAHAVIDVGSVQYAILSIDGENMYYKTSTFSPNLIAVDQSLILEFEDADDTTPEVLLPTRNSVYAFPLESSNSGDFVIPLENIPDLNMGMLVFEDLEHCVRYYEDMREFVDDTIGDAEEKLDAFEEYFEGYQSFRTYFNNKHDFENTGYDSDQIYAIEMEDVLNDEVVKTLMNKDRMVIIGDSVYYQHSFYAHASCHLQDQEAITTLIDFKDEDDLYTGDFPLDVHPAIDIYDPLTIKGQTKDVNLDSANWRVESHLQIQNETCEPYIKKIRVALTHEEWNDQYDEWEPPRTYYLANPNAPDLIITIDWGDGTPLQIITDYRNSWVPHTYANTGTYTVTTNVQTNTIYGNFDDDDDHTISGVACTQFDAQKWGQTEVNDWKISTKLWLNDNFFGNHYGAYTHAWRLENGQWVRKKTHLRTIVDGVLRNNNCQPTQTVYGEKDRLNSKKVEKVKTKLFNHYDIANYDVKSVHLLWQGSIHINYTVYLTPCN